MSYNPFMLCVSRNRSVIAPKLACYIVQIINIKKFPTVDYTGKIVNFTGFFMKTNGSTVKLAENFINQTESGDYLTNFYDDGTWEFYFVSSGTGIKNSGNRELILLQGTWTKTEDNKLKILIITNKLNYNTLRMKAVPAEEQEQNTVLETYSGNNGYNEIDLDCMLMLESKVNPEAYE